jgi:hypothetical protein
MSNIVRLPYCVASRKIIQWLIDAGWLLQRRRHDACAVETALTAAKEDTRN